MLIEGSCGYFDSASENTWKSDGDFILRWLGIRCEGKTGNTFGWGTGRSGFWQKPIPWPPLLNLSGRLCPLFEGGVWNRWWCRRFAFQHTVTVIGQVALCHLSLRESKTGARLMGGSWEFGNNSRWQKVLLVRMKGAIWGVGGNKRIKEQKGGAVPELQSDLFFKQCQDFIATSTIASGKYTFLRESLSVSVYYQPQFSGSSKSLPLTGDKDSMFGVGASWQAEVRCDGFCSQV